MSSHRIVCTTQYPPDQSHDHAYIVSVGIDSDNDGLANEKMTLQEVLKKLDANESFYTVGTHSGQKIYVHEAQCCGKRYIKTYPDDYLDNNLDNLRKCNWS